MIKAHIITCLFLLLIGLIVTGIIIMPIMGAAIIFSLGAVGVLIWLYMGIYDAVKYTLNKRHNHLP